MAQWVNCYGLGCCRGMGSISGTAQWVKGLGIAIAAAQVAAVAQIQSLALELPYATHTAKTGNKKRSVSKTNFKHSRLISDTTPLVANIYFIFFLVFVE